MELDQAVRIVEAVANGVNPETGEVFSSDSPYNSPVVIRALFTCSQHLQQRNVKSTKTIEERQAENKRKHLPLNAGLPWTDEMKARLAAAFKSGASPADLAATFERTKYAVALELKKQGLLSEEEVRGMK